MKMKQNQNQKNPNSRKIDADGQILGRLAAQTAILLRGKQKAEFTYNANVGDMVDVYNLDKIRVSGKKMESKKYFSHSGYPGGIKETSLKALMKKDSREVFKKAVTGMLPANKLRKEWLKNLKLHQGEITNDQ